MKNKFKIISVVLAVSILLQFFTPSIIIAYDLFNNNIQTTKEEVKQPTSPAIKELIDKRQSNIKYFLKDDFTYEAMLYSNDVHYLKDGQYVDINNKLETKRDINDLFVESYENKDNSFKVKFFKKLNNNYIYRLKDDKYEIYYDLVGINRGINATKQEQIADDDITTLENIYDGLKYKNVYDNIDLSYLIMPNGVKENIILNENTNKTEFTYEINVKNLTLSIKDNVIYFANEVNEVIYTLEAPYMYDANNEINTDITLSLLGADGKYTVIMNISKEWLNSKERKYPVVIDPVVTSSIARANINDVHVSEGFVTTNYYNSYILKTGYGSSSKKNRSFIKFINLPPLQTGDMIINAYLQTSLATYYTTDHQVTVHKVTSNWNQTSVTWNNQPTYDSKVIDYDTITGSQYSIQSWNITAIAKDWYNLGNNYGLMLKNYHEAANYTEYYSADVVESLQTYRPVAVFQYVNNTGIENYWTYHSQNIGRAGTIYTNDYNGNLILKHFDTSTPGSRLPVSITHVYNTNDANDINGLPVNIGYGNGFRLNLSQTISSEFINQVQYYKYIDEDGTRQYFYQSGSVYVDETGLGLELSLLNNIFTMKDKGGNTSTFESYNGYWRLKTIKDSNNNTITINYNGNFISSVVDPTGDTITLTYTNNLLTSIKDANNKTTNYSYTNNNLTTITYPDSKYSTYTYDSRYLLTSAKNIDNSHLDYTYSIYKPYRVNNIKEYSTLNELGNTLSMNYSENTTKFIDNNNLGITYVFNNSGHTLSIMDYGKNGYVNEAYAQNYSYGTSGNIKNKLTLESNLTKPVVNNLLNGNAEYDGEWTSANWGNNPGTMSYTSETSYYGARSLKTSMTSSNQVHPTYSFPLFSQSVNLVKGATYTLSSYIKTNGINTAPDGAGAVLFIYYTTTSGVGVMKFSNGLRGTNEWTKHSLTFVYPTDIVGNINIAFGLRDTTGTAYFDAIQLEEGSVANNFNFIENSNFEKGSLKWYANGVINTAVDKVMTVDTNNNAMRITGEPTKDKNYYYNTYMSGKAGDIYTYGGFAKSFSIPYYDLKVTDITIGILNTDNTWQWVSRGILPDSNRWQYVSKEFITEKDYKNIVVYVLTYKNANEVYFDNIILYKDESGNSYAYDANGNLVNANDSAKQNTLTSYDNKNQLISTLLPSGSKLNYEYNYNYKNRLISATSKDGLSFNFTYDAFGNATSTKVSESSLASTIDVNQIYYIKAVPSNLYMGVNVSNIELMALGTNGNQEWKFNDLGNGYYNIKPASNITNQVMEAAGASTANFANIQIGTNIGGNHQQFKLIKNDDGTYTFKPKHIETSCVDINSANFNPATNIHQYACNNTVAQKFYIIKKDTSNNKYIETNQEYSTNGDYLTKQKDALGNVVIYNYNIDGTLNNVVDSKNKVTNYIYDNMGRITNISKSGYINSYSYTNDNLSSITHNGFNYNFIYDTFGNTKQVKVNDKVLITNNYASNNGNLLNSLYGNNQTVSYEYDRFNRVIKKTTGNNNIYEYMYDNRGNLAVTKDNTNTYNYSYDLADRLLKINSTNYNISYKYGINSNISNIDYKYLNNTNSVSYSYDTLARISSVVNGSSTINYNYDLLSRLNNKVLTVGNNTYQTNYSYITNNNKTSIILDSITNGSNILSYTYDANGNIDKILENNIEVAQYYYDDLNQLIKEDNAYLNQTITYNYDLGGNILNKTIYEYKTTNLLDTINYTYDTNWKDQLISYDNKQITYDQIGNPLTYDTYTYEWINGRQLSKIIDNTNTYQYKYNDSGIREEKIINGESTKYYLEGSNIIYQTNGSNIIYHMYDETGSIIGLKYNSNEYYYIKNAQNDIIGLLDSNLNKIVNYKYDSWGNIISITDNNGVDISNDPSHIGNINPYRYRSYYYDIESNLYYLQSRYYNPTWGRFINADGYVTTGTGILGNNMYAYANNNPIMYIDPSGHFIILPMLGLISGIGAVFLGNTIYQGNKSKDIIKKIQKKTNVPDKTDLLNSKLNQSSKDINKEVSKIPGANLYQFSQVVKTNSKYDLKNQKEWKQTISYNGLIMEPQDIGNFHYGYIGRAAGLDILTLTSGAGVYQMLGETRNVLGCFSLSFCDDSRDTYYIIMGAIKYDKEH